MTCQHDVGESNSLQELRKQSCVLLTYLVKQTIAWVGGSSCAFSHQGAKSTKKALTCGGSVDPLPCLSATYLCGKEEFLLGEIEVEKSYRALAWENCEVLRLFLPGR